MRTLEISSNKYFIHRDKIVKRCDFESLVAWRVFTIGISGNSGKCENCIFSDCYEYYDECVYLCPAVDAYWY